MLNILKTLSFFKKSTKTVTYTCENTAQGRAWVKRGLEQGFKLAWNGQVWRLTKVISV